MLNNLEEYAKYVEDEMSFVFDKFDKELDDFIQKHKRFEEVDLNGDSLLW